MAKTWIPRFYECRGVVITAAEFEVWLAAQPKHPPVSRDVVATFTGYLRSCADDQAALDLANVLERYGVVIGWAQDLIEFAEDHSELVHLFAPGEERETRRPGIALYWDWRFARQRASRDVRS